MWHVFENCSQALLVCLMKNFQNTVSFSWQEEILNEDQALATKVL